MINEKQVNPEIEIKMIKNNESVYFTFDGKFTKKEAISAVKKWKQLLESKNSKQIHIWNCLEMKGYEPMDRSIWQKAIKEMKGKIDKVWLISDSTIILTGAKIMSLFTAFEIKAIKSENDIFY